MATLPGTLRQSAKILALFEDTPCDQIQAILRSGLMADLRDANIDEINRNEFRKLCGLAPIVEKPREFVVFRTVKLGVHKTPEAYRQAHITAGFWIEDYAGQVLDVQTPIGVEDNEVDLVVVTPADLGLKKEPRFKQICDKATALGLQICPREVGPALRLAYPDQPLKEWLWIAMEPVDSPGDDLSVFAVEHGGTGQWLRTSWFSRRNTWDLGVRLVFVQPRK